MSRERAAQPDPPPTPNARSLTKQELAQVRRGEMDAPTMVLDVRSLSRADLERIHRGEVDTEVLTALVEQTRGLMPGKPPAEGELLPREGGWLLAVGAPRQRLFPKMEKWITGTPGLVAFGNVWLNLIDAPRMGFVLGLAASLALGLAPVFFIWGGLRLWVRRRWQRLWGTALPPAGLAEAANGTVVRVTGVIPAQPTVPSLFRGVPAVLSRNRLGNADELRGIDFWLDLGPLPREPRVRLRVAVRDAYLLDEPRPTAEPPACGPVTFDKLGLAAPGRLRSELFTLASWWHRRYRRHEIALGPGDHIEVSGILTREPAPDGTAGPGRPTPMRLVLRGDANTPLLIRKA